MLGCLGFALGGIALIARAIRGRLILGTTLCGACRFDLAGIPNAVSCPECGGSLVNPGAVVPRRIRSNGLLWLGIVIAAIPILLGGTTGVLIASKATFNSIKPMWLLKAEALQGAPNRSSAALSEITRRIRAGSLSDAGFSAIANTAISLRRNRAAAWNRGWSEVIELARVSGKVTDSEWTEYVRYSIVPIERHRKKLRQGAEAPFGLTLTGPQLTPSPAPGAQATVRYGIVRGTLGDNEFVRSDQLDTSATISGSGSSGTTKQIKIDAPIGMNRMNLTWHFEVLDPIDNKTLGTWEQEFADEVVVLPADGIIVESKANPALAPAVQRSLKPHNLQRHSGGYASLMVNADRPPANLAFDVFALPRTGPKAGALLPMGQISFVQGSSSGFGIGSDSKDLETDSIDLVLHPSARAAELNSDLEWVWTGPDIIYEDIKVESKSP